MDLLITGRFHQKSLDLFRGKTVVVEGEDRFQVREMMFWKADGIDDLDFCAQNWPNSDGIGWYWMF